jgi:hypothetical protein
MNFDLWTVGLDAQASLNGTAEQGFLLAARQALCAATT